MRKSLLILILTIFVLTSAPAMAGGGKTDVNSVGNLNFTDKVVYFLDHTSDPDEGNWITMGCPDEARSIQLPQPIELTYNGPKYKEYGGASGTLNKEEGESYTITYPSTSPYCTHPIYLPTDDVTISYYGKSDLNGDVEVYLLKVDSDCIYGIFDAFQAGNIGDLDNLFHSNIEEGDYKKYYATLGDNGDLLDYDLGPLDAGEYSVVMLQENDDGSLTVLSATAFVVTEYDLGVSSLSSIKKGNNLGISITGVPDETACTYGAVLIKKQAYKANIEINSDGTRDGTSVIINDIDIIDEFDINSSNYRSKLTKNELQTEIQTLIGAENGAIAIGETDQKTLSLTTFDLPVDSYYLLVGAYSPEKGLVGLSQKVIEIKSSGGSSSGGSGGGGGSPEPAKNVKIKELCQKFVSNGNRIRFEFTKEATPVGYVQFNAKKTAGKITTIVEELKEKSSLTPTEPEGEIYKHLNIWVGNGGFANSNNIENAIVGFRISKDWITENNINMDTITLQHFSGDQWNSLNTEKVGEDEEYLYLEAETPGFSPFAITASKNILEVGEKAGETEDQSTVDAEQQDNSETGVESETASKEKGNSGLKIVSFFIGFLVIILTGAIIKKNIDKNNEDEDEDSEE
ncbi:MAG: TIGR04279 domain-containing protein [Methanosarcina sp.]|uniref:TIGR04279 domain-containing protein n=1 Tax=Methanosarcina sp. TaxID=2213 RepID=UPI00262F15BC|nr:TIGR04279 domain-containing protein [Methanosarcina sp.]MDD3245415.1 TIGR04279 domain-containing protein [Methanosarcina sp.]MDD4248084.1 TIGR04279 domain-containing protein [Methanosarcina sp.]